GQGVDEFARAELVRSFVAESYADRSHADRRMLGTNGHTSRPEPAGGQAAVWEALRSLPPRRRAVIVLRYDEGLSEEQIADRLGRPRNNIIADAEAGMLTLRTALNGYGDPGQLVPAALAEARYHWSDWFGSNGAPAENGSASAVDVLPSPPQPAQPAQPVPPD